MLLAIIITLQWANCIVIILVWLSSGLRQLTFMGLNLYTPALAQGSSALQASGVQCTTEIVNSQTYDCIPIIFSIYKYLKVKLSVLFVIVKYFSYCTL